jgi:hypothetical protein
MSSTSPDTQPRNAAGSIIAATIVASVAYAVIRYHLVGTVPWSSFPLFILNKGICLGGMLLLGLNFGLGPLRNIGANVPDRWLDARQALGMTGFLLILFHVLMSFLLFTPDIFGKFFNSDGSLTLFGSLSMLGGVSSFVVLWAYNLSFQTHMREDARFIRFITSRKFMLWSMLLAGGHLFFMGYEGWMNPAGWPGGLPPISLVAFSAFAIVYVINLIGRE